MQLDEQPNKKPRTPEEDVEAVNSLDAEQVWLYALALAVPPGSRIVAREAVCAKLGIDDDDASSLQSILFYCADILLTRTLTPTSLLRALGTMSLEMERANLLVDVAISSVQSAPGASLPEISAALSRLNNAVAGIQTASTPPSAT